MKANDGVVALLAPLLGPAIWFICFNVVYAITTAVCEGVASGGRVIQISVSSVVVLLGAAAQMWTIISSAAAPISNEAFSYIKPLKTALASLSLVATVWLLLPLALLPTC